MNSHSATALNFLTFLSSNVCVIAAFVDRRQGVGRLLSRGCKGTVS